MRPEPGPGSVVVFQLLHGGIAYPYAALHVAGKGWYLTAGAGRAASPIPWNQLDQAVPGPIWVASGWYEIPARPCAKRTPSNAKSWRNEQWTAQTYQGG